MDGKTNGSQWMTEDSEDKLLEIIKELRTEVVVCYYNILDAEKTDLRWQGVAPKIYRRVEWADNKLEEYQISD